MKTTAPLATDYYPQPAMRAHLPMAPLGQQTHILISTCTKCQRHENLGPMDFDIPHLDA